MVIRRLARLAVLAACCRVMGAPQEAHADWTGDGLRLSLGSVGIEGYACPFCPEPFASSMTSDGAGGTILAWSEARATRYQVFTQRLDASGARLWGPYGVPVAAEAGDQTAPTIVPDGSGGAIVVWVDTRGAAGGRLYAQHVVDGLTVWQTDGVALCTAAGGQVSPVAAIDGAGGVIVAWRDGRPGFEFADIYAQRVDATGAIPAGWPATGVALCTAPGGQDSPAIIPDGIGGAIVAWSDLRSGTGVDSDLYLQHVTAAGTITPGWAANGNPASTHGRYQLNPTLVSDGAGGAIVTWRDDRIDIFGDVWVQRMTGAGLPQWTAAGIALTNSDGRGQYHPTIVSDEAGGAVIGWEDATSASVQHLYAQRVNASGVSQWAPGGVVVCSAPGYRYDPQLTSDRAGGAFITWVDQRVPSRSSVFAQRIGATGTPQWMADGIRVGTSDEGQNVPSIAALDNGGTVVVWYDLRQGATGLYAGSITGDGVVPVALSLVAVDATAEEVRLTWFAAGGGVQEASIERSEAARSWRPLGVAIFPVNDLLTYVDRDVTPGARYGYRLAITTANGFERSAESWVEIPDRPILTLEGARPNPARTLRVAFSLPGGDPASLDLFDVSGRLVSSREVGSLGSGRHVIDLDPASALRPGTYYLRLARDDRSLWKKVSIVR